MRGLQDVKFSRPVNSPRSLLLLLLLCLVLSILGYAGEFPAAYNSEKTPGQPMSAAEAAAKWRVPPGFKVSVFAAEPDVQNPIACAWDPRGRLWIAENYTYAERPMRWEEKLNDRVLVFEDSDGDGKPDKRTIFTQDVRHLTSIEVGLGGIWLMCPPQLLFIPDRDHDDKPDGPAEAVLDGFEVPAENYHNFANGLRWGPDGWLYGRCGASAPGLIGAPNTPNEQRIPLAGGIWRYHPQRKVFEALCHGTTNPWGSDWNEDGEMFFTNTVNGQLWHMIPGAHYTRPHTIDPNPNVYELIDQHADHYHFDTGKGWAASRDGANGADALGGGHAHCGAMVYLGDNWPAEYRGKLLTLNFHGRRMNVERLDHQGSGYIGRHEPDICFSADPFFRGIDLTYGPDGGVYVLDWSDTGECHENTGVHRTSGRIYKITYGTPARSAADLTQLNEAELVKLHEHPNEWYARMARRELNDRQFARNKASKDEANPVLKKEFKRLIAESKSNQIRIRAFFSLWSLNQLDPESIKELFSDRDECIRALSARAFCDFFPLDLVSGKRRREFTPKDQESAIEFLTMAARDERSPVVRLALASCLSRLDYWSRQNLAVVLATHREDAADHNIPLLIWYALASSWRYGDQPFTDVLFNESWRLPTVRKYSVRLGAETAESPGGLLEGIVHSAATAQPAMHEDILNGLSQGFTGWRKARKPVYWDALAARVIEAGDPLLVAKVRDLNVLFGDGRALDDVKKIVLDDKADLETRKTALRSLIEARPNDLRMICERVISVRFLNVVAARGLALSDDPAIGGLLAKNYKSFHPSERGAVIETLASRPAFARTLLDEVTAGRIAREDISAYHARQIRSFNIEALTNQLGQVWGEIRESAADKRELMATLKASLTPEVLSKADKSAGRLAFNQVCATCHTLYGQGGQIGPDLTGSGRSNIDYLLENIIDPGAVVNADFRLNVVTLKDGRVLNGMIAARTDRTLTLKTMTEPVTIEQSEIVKRDELPQSLMPEGLLQTFSEQHMRDLFAYLMHPSQVALSTESSR